MSSSANRTDRGSAGQDDDMCMTRHHKQLLGENRSSLVENMIPAQILNLLMSSQVLSGHDVTHIKEKGNFDAMNECLLDFLVRKPDHAFMEFVNALRSTDQAHVANLLEKRGPILAVHIGATSLTSDDLPAMESRLLRNEALLTAIDNEILMTLRRELHNLNTTVHAEISPQSISERKPILETCSELLRFHRVIDHIEEGSVVIWVMCPTLEALDDLWQIYTSGKLQQMFLDAFIRDEHRKAITINLTVDKGEWQRCRQQLLSRDVFSVMPDVDVPAPEKKKAKKRSSSTNLPDTSKAHKSLRPDDKRIDIGKMAVQRPSAFDFGNPDTWPEWVEQWELYRNEKLDAEPDEVQITSLLRTMGGDAEDIVKSLKLSDNQRQQYQCVREALDGHFSIKYVIPMRCLFYTRKQEYGETAQHYISTIRKIATKCDFVDVSNRVRDRLVSGISDNVLSTEMQKMTELQLTEQVAIDMVLTAEKKKAKKRPSSPSLPGTSKAFKSPCRFEIRSSQLPPVAVSRPVPSTSSVEQSGNSDTNPMHGNATATPPTIKSEPNTSIQEVISKIKAKAAEKGTHTKFFNDKVVQDLLLQLEGLQKDEQVWKGVFSDLADQLHCKEPTVKNRVNTLILDHEINEKLLQLKRAIALEMPDLIKKRNEECKKTDEAKAARLLQGLSADSKPRIAIPQRKFEWTELIRGLLFDVVTKKKKLLSGKNAANKLQDFFEFEVAVLWPEKWMQIRKLWTTTASVHQLPWPKNALKTPTKKMNIAGTLERQLLRDNPSGRSEEAAVDIAGSTPTPSSSTVYVKQEVADGYKYSTAACISTPIPVTSPTVRVKVEGSACISSTSNEKLPANVIEID